MENMVDIFNQSMFSTTSLTASIQIVPNMYGRINELGVFGTPEGVNTNSVVIELENGVLNLLQSKPRGTPSAGDIRPKRGAVNFMIPHLPHEDQIKAEEVMGIREFGSASQMQTVQSQVNRRLIGMANKHFITWEFHRAGALNGQIFDADGTLLVDLFTSFNVTEKVVDFDFAAVTDVGPKITEVLRHIEDNLLGDVSTGVRCLCSETFFDALIAHASVKDAYANYTSESEPLRRDVRKGFTHKGVTFEEYRGRATYQVQDGTTVSRKFIAEGEARFFPEGTMDTFRHYCGPADFVETVNTIGQPLYAKQELGKHGRWVDVHTQSNPLFLCLRPQVLVKGTVT